MFSDKKLLVPSNDVMLSAKEAATLLQCAPDYITKLAREGKLDGVQTSKGWQVTHSSLKRYEAIRDAQKAERSSYLAQERRRELVASTPITFKQVFAAFMLSLVFGATTFSIASVVKHDVISDQSASLARVESPFFTTVDIGGVFGSIRDSLTRLFAPQPQGTVALPNISAPNTATTTIVNNYTNPVVERIVERITPAHPATLTVNFSDWATAFEERFERQVDRIYDVIGDLDTGGISTITDADVPDDLTASNYLPLSGGTLTGALIGTTATFDNSTITNSTTTNATTTTLVASNFFVSGIAEGCAEFNASGKLTSTGTNCGTGGGGADGNWVYFSGSGIRLATTSNQVVIGATATSSNSKVQIVGGLTVDSATTTNATTTNLAVSATASTSALVISSVPTGLLKTSAGGVVSAAVAGTDYENALTFSYPLTRSSNTISLAFGTTTSNTWAGTQTFTNAPVLSTLSGLVAANSGATYATATGTVAAGTGISVTAGQYIIGSGLTITNTGVTSLSGTTNQITASAATGAVTLSLPNHVIFPGSFVASSASTTNATSTNITATGIASTSALYISNVANAILSTNNGGAVSATTIQAPLSFSGNTLSITQATGSTDGYLSSTHWNVFNNKVSSTSLQTFADTYKDWSIVNGALTPTTTLGIILNASSSITNLSSIYATSTYATSTSLAITGALTFNGVTGSTWAAFCTTITGSADLCDGSDASGGGGGGTDVNWTYFNGSGIRPSTSTNQVVVGGTATSSLLSPLAKLGVFGGASFDYASTTGISATYASSTNAIAGNLTVGVLNGLLKATSGAVSTASPGTDYLTNTFKDWNIVGGALVPTSTLGVIVSASSTIGSGTQAGGLTISGGATTTGSLVVQGSATTTSLGISNVANTLLSANAVGAVTATSSVSVNYLDGILPVTKGGTGASTLSSGQLLYGAGVGAVQTVATGTVAGGTGISVTAGQYIIGSGLTITNTGVTSLAGTANQITASAATGAVTLSLPNHVIFPGSFVASEASTTNATSTNLTATGIASTTALYISGITSGNILKTSTGGQVVAAAAGTDYLTNAFKDWNIVGGALVPTSTLGVIVSASSTIGSGTQAGGLTISGGATTTGSLVVQGNATTTNLSVSATASTTALYISNVANAILSTNNGGAVSATTISAPLSFSGNTLSITQATGSTDGYLTSTDWTLFNNKVSSTSLQTFADTYRDWSIVGGALVPTTTLGVIVSASSTIGSGTQAGGLTISGGATTTGSLLVQGSATTTNLSVSATASTSALIVSALGQASNQCVTSNSIGLLSLQTCANFSYPFPNNATTTILTFSAGFLSGTSTIGSLTATSSVKFTNYLSGALATDAVGALYTYSTSTWAFASSTLLADHNTFSGNNRFTGGTIFSASTTIGSGAQAGGLTISGGATTTGNQYTSGNLLVVGNATTSNLDITGNITFNSVTGSTWASFCTAITGSSDLCDASDAAGSGGDSNWTFFNTSGIRLATTTNQVLVGHTATSSATAKLEVVGGNILHIASSAPTLATTSATASKTYDVAVVGRLAYLADFDTGLRIIDVSNPALTAVVGTYSTGLDNAVSVAAANNYAFIGDEFAGIKIIDVANPASPTLVSTYSSITGPYDLEISGKYLFAVDYNDSELHIVDVSDPASPAVAAVYTSGLSAPYGVTVQGRYAYVASQNNGDIVIVDISNPKSPAHVGTYAAGTAPASTYVSGKYLYVADVGGGFYILDVSNPTSPALVTGSTYNAGGSYYGVQVAGTYAYLTEHAGTMRVVNVANPQSVSLVGSYSTGGAPWNVAVSGKYAYVAADTSGLKVIDINGIEAPAAHIGAIETNTANISDTLAVGGDITANGSLNVGISGIFSRGTIAAYIASSTQSNPMVATFMGGNVGVGTSTAYSKITAWGAGQLFEAVNNASTTIFSIGQSGATTTNFSVSGHASTTGLTISGTLSSLLKTNASGQVVAAVAGADYLTNAFKDWDIIGGALVPTSTIGVIVSASSTIGSGTQAGGLTISGGATTTGNAYFASNAYFVGNVGVGTTSPMSKLTLAGGSFFQAGGDSTASYTPTTIGGVEYGITIGVSGSPGKSMTAAGNTLYVANTALVGTGCSASDSSGCEVRIYDVSTSSPNFLGGVDTYGANSIAVAVTGNYLFVGSVATTTGSGCSSTDASNCEIRIYDVSNPTSPAYLNGIDATTIESMVISGRYLYVTTINIAGTCSAGILTGCEFRIYDISDPANPRAVGGFGDGTMLGLEVKGNYAYITRVGGSAEEFAIVDISNPSSPTILDSMELGGVNGGDIAVQGNYAYVAKASGGIAEELIVYDISNPNSIATTTGIDLGGLPQSLEIQGRYLYVAFTSATGSFRIYDVSDPYNLVQVGGANVTTATNLAVKGNRAYVGYTTVSGDELRVYDITGAEVQTLLAHSLEAGALAVRGNSNVAGNLFTNGLNVGNTGILSGGPLSVYVGTTSSAVLNAASFMGGNVGVGTTSPWGQLSVNPNGITGPAFVIGSSTGTNFIVTNAGDVGIGMEAPTRKLEVNGEDASTFVSGGVVNGIVRILNTNNTTNNTASLSFGSVDGSGNPKTAATITSIFTGRDATTVTADLVFQMTSANEMMRLTSTGNLGIGSTSPYAKLAVTNTGTAPSFTVEDESADATPFIVDNSGKVGIGTTSPVANLGMEGSIGVNATQLYLAGSGNVGVGTSTPSHTLTVHGNTHLYGNLTASSTAPTFVGSTANDTNSQDSPIGVAIQGRYAYVTSQGTLGDNLSVIDISTPSNPVTIASTSVAAFGADPTDIVVSGNYAYIAMANSNRINVLDISNPYKPTSVGSINGTMTSVSNLYLSGKYLYAVAANSDSFTIIDISEPESPRIVGQITSGTALNLARDVVVQGRYAYVAANSDAGSTDSRVTIIDVADPANPVIASTTNVVASMSDTRGIDVSGRYAYVTSLVGNSLVIFDISSSTSPSWVGEITNSTLLGGANFVKVRGKYAYVSLNTGDGITVVDVSNPAAPYTVGRYTSSTGTGSLDSAQHFEMAGRYLYATGLTDDNFVVLDIGSELPALSVGDLAAGTFFVQDNAQISNDLNVGRGLTLGGNLQVFGTSTIATTTFTHNAMGVGTTTPGATFAVTGSGTGNSFVFQAADSTNEAQFSVTNNGKLLLGTTTTSSNTGLTMEGGNLQIRLFDSNVAGANWGIVGQTGNTTKRFRIMDLESNSERFSIAATGEIGIGSTTPWRTLSVTGTMGVSSGITAIGGGNDLIICHDPGTFEVLRSTSATTCTSSSLRYKENIAQAPYGLDSVMLMNPVTFQWKARPAGDQSRSVGFIAEEMLSIVPEVVNVNAEGQPESVEYAFLVPVLARAIQELNLNLASISSTTASSTPQSQAFATNFFDSLFNRLVAWLGDTGNGIADLFATTITAETVHAERLCLKDAQGETCITKSELDALLAGQDIEPPAPVQDQQDEEETPPAIPPEEQSQATTTESTPTQEESSAEEPPAETPAEEPPAGSAPATEEPSAEEGPSTPPAETPAE